MIWKAIAIAAIWIAPWIVFIIGAIKGNKVNLDVAYSGVIGILQTIATIAVVLG